MSPCTERRDPRAVAGKQQPGCCQSGSGPDATKRPPVIRAAEKVKFWVPGLGGMGVMLGTAQDYLLQQLQTLQSETEQ